MLHSVQSEVMNTLSCHYRPNIVVNVRVTTNE